MNLYWSISSGAKCHDAQCGHIIRPAEQLFCVHDPFVHVCRILCMSHILVICAIYLCSVEEFCVIARESVRAPWLSRDRSPMRRGGDFLRYRRYPGWFVLVATNMRIEARVPRARRQGAWNKQFSVYTNRFSDALQQQLWTTTFLNSGCCTVCTFCATYSAIQLARELRLLCSRCCKYVVCAIFLEFVQTLPLAGILLQVPELTAEASKTSIDYLRATQNGVTFDETANVVKCFVFSTFDVTVFAVQCLQYLWFVPPACLPCQ